MSDDFAAVRYWYNNRESFPQLYKVSCRIYATPLSSCAIEHVFSALNRVVTRDLASIRPKTMDKIIVVRSLVDNLTLKYSASA